MKKYILIALIAVTPMFASAQVVDEPTPELTPEPVIVEPAPTPVVEAQPQSHSGGYMYVCSYVKAYSKQPCTDSRELQMAFVFNQAFRESILSPWRIAVFGDIFRK